MSQPKLALMTEDAGLAHHWRVRLDAEGIELAQFFPGLYSPEQVLSQGFGLVCREPAQLDDFCLIESWGPGGQSCYQASLSPPAGPRSSRPECQLTARGLAIDSLLDALLPDLSPPGLHPWISRPVPDGPMSEHQRQVLLIWSLVEAALCQTHARPGLSSSSELSWEFVQFFVLGDESALSHPIGSDLKPQLERQSLAEWLRAERACLYFAQHADFYRDWWRLAEVINDHQDLRVLSLSEVAANLPTGSPPELVRSLFDCICQKRLGLTEECSDGLWFLGQLGICAAFPDDQLLGQFGQAFRPDLNLLQAALKGAVERGLCSPRQARHWARSFPLFPTYPRPDNIRRGLSVSQLSRRILGGGREVENDLDVVNAIICDRSRQRFLLERKVNHPDPLCDTCRCLVGGFRQNAQEGLLSAWRREAAEEWTDLESLAIAHKLADRAVAWRRFQVQGAERGGEFGMEVLLIELESEEFERFASILVANNCPQNRPEGWPEVYLRREIPELALLSGHQLVLAAFLEVSG